MVPTSNQTNSPMNESEEGQIPFHGQNLLGIFGAVLIILLSVTGVAGNALALLAIAKCPKLRKSHNALIASLALTDFLFNVTIMPFYVDTYINKRWRFSLTFCQLETYFGTMLVMSSALHIGFIAANRYFLIVQPSHYEKVSTKSAIFIQVCLIWSICLLTVLPGALGWQAVVGYSDQIGRCNYIRSESKGSLTLIFVIGFILPCLMMIPFYLLILKKLESSRMRLDSYSSRLSSRSSNHPCQRASPVRKINRHLCDQGNEHSRALMGNENDTSNCVSDKCPTREIICLKTIQFNSSHESTEQETHIQQEVKNLDISPKSNMHMHNHILSGCGALMGTGINSFLDKQTSCETLATRKFVINAEVHSTNEKVKDSGPKKHPKENIKEIQSAQRYKLPSKMPCKNKGHGEIIPCKVSTRKHSLISMEESSGIANSGCHNTAEAVSTGEILKSRKIERIPRQSHSPHPHYKSLKMVSAVFMAFVFTYLPFTIINLVDEKSQLPREWYMISSLAFWAGASLNPLIYGVMNRQFREAYRLVLVCGKQN